MGVCGATMFSVIPGDMKHQEAHNGYHSSVVKDFMAKVGEGLAKWKRKRTESWFYFSP